jgi:hypothetical protein
MYDLIVFAQNNPSMFVGGPKLQESGSHSSQLTRPNDVVPNRFHPAFQDKSVLWEFNCDGIRYCSEAPYMYINNAVHIYNYATHCKVDLNNTNILVE